MNDQKATELLQLAGARFAKLGGDRSRIRYLLAGFWFGAKEFYEKRPASVKSQADRVRWCESTWTIANPDEPDGANPYTPVLEFIDAGGHFGRQENGVIDVWFPSGNKFGIPASWFFKSIS